MNDIYSMPFAVMIPFFNKANEVIKCISSIKNEIKDNGWIILINDGSSKVELTKIQAKVKSYNNVRIITHQINRGVSSARNTGVEWCIIKNIKILIMIDSDSTTKDKCIFHHLLMHYKMPSLSILGGAIFGEHVNLAGKIDGIASWVHSIPYKKWHEVTKPYHLPTNNLSIKTEHFSEDIPLFQKFLKTGEDAYFIKTAQENRKKVFFSPLPQISHKDRNNFFEVIKHHFEWGHHQYFLLTRWNEFKLSFNPIFRIFFFIFFLCAFPFYVVLGSCLNTYPWLRYKSYYSIYYPFLFLLWFIKALAIFEAIVRPLKCSK
jgi:glycosyltransferase involved in cell wall biosynthesis